MKKILLALALCTLPLRSTAQTPVQSQPKLATSVTAAWTSSTGNDTALTLTTTGLSSVTVTFWPNGTVSGGTLNFEASDDNGTTWYPMLMLLNSAAASSTTLVQNSYGMSAGKAYLERSIPGFNRFRVRLNPQVSGAGTANIRISASAFLGQHLAASTVEQFTQANLNATVHAGTNTSTAGLLTTSAHDAALGTAGSADAQVRSIQGIAAMTPVQVQSNSATVLGDSTYTGRTPAGASPADNESNTNTALSRVGAFNFLFDGSTWDRWPGTAADGALVNLGANNDVTIAANSSVNLNQVAGAAPSNTNPVPARLTDGTSYYDARAITGFPDNEPFNQAQLGGVAIVAGPCQREMPIYVSIDQTTGTEVVNGTASERIYICSVTLHTATAQNIAWVTGTGSVCATSIEGIPGINGGTTAGEGNNMVAGGQYVLNYNPMGWGKTQADDENVCILQSGAGQVSGGFSYVSIPNI
jgi:hypothetical protein